MTSSRSSSNATVYGFPTSQASIVAKIARSRSTKSARRNNKRPRAEVEIPFHSGLFRAARAALTAILISSAFAQATLVITVSSLGLIVSKVWPDWEGTKLLLMNKPGASCQPLDNLPLVTYAREKGSTCRLGVFDSIWSS